jgi:hypothetical protein
MTNRTYEVTKLQPGQRITYSGFSGTVIDLYDDGEIEGARMYNVRLPGGTACICGADLVPVL